MVAILATFAPLNGALCAKTAKSTGMRCTSPDFLGYGCAKAVARAEERSLGSRYSLGMTILIGLSGGNRDRHRQRN
jgi:hypothetical protein